MVFFANNVMNFTVINANLTTLFNLNLTNHAQSAKSLIVSNVFQKANANNAKTNTK